MKQYQIRLGQQGKVLDFTIPYKSRKGIFFNFGEFCNYLFSKLALLFIFLIPLSGFIAYKHSQEKSSFVFFILFTIGLLTLLSIDFVLFGSKRVIDPQGIFQVLMFALLLTIAAVLLTDPNINYTANTFGAISSSAVKGFSGLAIICFVSLFYIISRYFAFGLERIHKIFNFLTISFSLYLLLFLFNIVPIKEVSISLMIIAVALFLRELINSQNKVVSYFSIVGAISSFLIIFRNLGLNESDISIYLTCSLIASIPFLFYSFRNRREMIVVNINEFIMGLEESINSLINQNLHFGKLTKWARPLFKLGILLTPFLILLALIFMFAIEGEIKVINEAIKDIDKSINTIGSDIQSVIVGQGSSITSSKDSMLASIIEGSGLLGVVAYLIIWGLCIVKIFKTLASGIFNNKEQIRSLYITTSFIAIFIQSSMFFIYPGLDIILIWWVMFAVILNVPFLLETKYKILKVSNIEKIYIITDTKNGIRMRKFLSLIALLIGIGLIIWIINMVGEVI